MLNFIYQSLPVRAVFAENGLAQIAAELDKLGCQRALILTTPEQQDLGAQVDYLLQHRSVGVYPHAVMHVPVEVARNAQQEAKMRNADCCVAVGGGSTIGLGKAIALSSDLPVIAVPTTYAGSEMTPIWGLTEDRIKKTGRDLRVLPKTVIYDPALTVTLPADISACSGMNAMAHAVEALYAQDANPIISMMAEDAIRALAQSLPRTVENPQDLAARSQSQYGAWLAGVCLGSVGMAIHHKLCHTLGGTFNLPHAQLHAVLLPYSVHYNKAAAEPALQRVAQALGGERAEQAGPLLFALNRTLGVPRGLAELGFPVDGPAEAAEIACRSPYYNPRAFERQAIEALLERARLGLEPV